MPNPQIIRTVSGQLSATNNQTLPAQGLTVQAFDADSANTLAPLSNVQPVPDKGRYQIHYAWESTGGRNGPNLLIRVYNSQGEVVGEAFKRYAGVHEVLDMAIDTPEQSPVADFVVKGKVRQSDGHALAGVLVRIIDWDMAGEDFLAETHTNANGYYEARYSAAQFRSSAREVGGADLVVQVYNGQGQLLATSPRRNNAQTEETVDLSVAVIAPSAKPPFVVKGHIVQAGGLALAGVEVRAFDRDLRSEQLLGRQTTDAAGYYEITYSSEQFRRSEKARADLTLRLFAADGQELESVSLAGGDGKALEQISITGDDGQPNAISIWFNAPAEAVINATVADEAYQGLSEYERYVQAVEPLLDGAALADLTANDIAFLAKELAIDARLLTYLQRAAQYQALSQIDAPVFYGLFRQNLPTELALLLVRKPNEWRTALQRSLDNNLIPRRLDSSTNKILDQLQRFLAHHFAGDSTDGSASPLTDLLRSAIPDAAVRQQFIAEFATHDNQDSDTFWQRLQNQPAFQNGTVETVRFTLQAYRLAFNHLPLAQALQQAFQQASMVSIRDLARLDVDGWRDFLATNISGQTVGTPSWVAGDNQEEREHNYALALMDMAEAAFPSTAFAARLQRDSDLPHRQDLLTFLNNNPDFDWEATPFSRYVAERGDDVLVGVKNPIAIAAAQRVFKIAPRYSLMKPLLTDGLTSALAVSQFGEARFVAQYGTTMGGEAQAQTIYRRAEAQSTMALAVMSKHHASFDQVRPWVIPSETPTVPESTTVPDLTHLFGSLTQCQCRDCQSIYSPAAYLVDCLSFLKQHGLLETLQSRRPDMSALWLTCENSHTPLPYIDLVNEILEAAVINAAPESVVTPQTTHPAEELLAIPEHIQERAYKILANANTAYPFQLPFNLWLETARVYFRHLGTSRLELLELFGAEDSTEKVWEALGISADDGVIIATQQTDAAVIGNFYDAEAGFSLEQLHTVPLLLQRTGLSYAELLMLLDAGFINPERGVGLEEIGGETGEASSCDLERYALNVATPAFFDRLHRFLRLQRALGWEIPDLDHALSLFSAGQLDLQVCQKLVALIKLVNTLNQPLPELLSVWDKEITDLRLAKLLRIAPNELAYLQKLLPSALLQGNDPAQTLEFSQRAENIRQSRFSAIELAYLYLHDPDSAAILEPDDGQLRAVIRALAVKPDESATDADRQAFVIQTLADAVKLDSQVIRQLKDSVFSADTVIFATQTLQTDAAPGSEAIPPGYKDAFLKLQKLALLIQRFELSADEVSHFVASGVLSLADLPVVAITFVEESSALAHWEYLNAYVLLRQQVPKRKTHLIDALIASDASLAQTRLMEATGWTDEEISGLAFPGDMQNPERLLRRYRQIALSRRLRLSLDKLTDWSDSPQADDIRTTLQNQYGFKQWLAIARPLENVLREKRRDALVAYLIYRPSLWLSESAFATTKPSPNSLYEHFLIDVEMSACQLTSRIRQAIGSVQLFVQRCQMGLETGLELDNDASRQWDSWRKTYRYWEANRKVFVYPENWIEPELRDDKSPFFKTLENALLQNEVTQDAVEQAYSGYLQQLNEVARLEIVGMYVEEDERIIHVFGRTAGIPHRYYYRRLLETSSALSWLSGRWTAWEKVELDIDGDHLLPVVWNRRLYLFWPVFTEKAQQGQLPREDASSEERLPQKYVEIQLAYSEYRDGQWVAKKLSKEKVNHNNINREPYLFKAFVRGENLVINCYIYDESTKSDLSSEFLIENCSGDIIVNTRPEWLPYIFPIHGSRFFMNQIIEDQLNRENRSLSNDPLYLKETISSTACETLRQTPGTYKLLPPHQFQQFSSAQMPFFFQDNQRSFLVSKEIDSGPSVSNLLSHLDDLSVALNIDYIPPIKAVDHAFELSPVNHGALASNPKPLEIFSIRLMDYPQIASSNLENIQTLFQAFKRYHFQPSYHPYICLFLKQLNRYGIEGLLDPKPNPAGASLAEPEASKLRRQRNGHQFFDTEYAPNRQVVARKAFDPVDDIDFSLNGAYSQYNWELFFHAPLLVADRLMQNQRFAEAQQWFHYIFDPTVGQDPTVTHSDPARFWKVKPFYKMASHIETTEQLMLRLNAGDPELELQVRQWQSDPFNPHRIARLRITAYMKTVVMKYLDNLIAWGDYLFRQDTLETLGEATQLYVLAANILGSRPQTISPRGTASPKSFNDLEPGLDALGNALVGIEEQLPAFGELAADSLSGDRPTMLYFCIPGNDKLLNY